MQKSNGTKTPVKEMLNLALKTHNDFLTQREALIVTLMFNLAGSSA